MKLRADQYLITFLLLAAASIRFFDFSSMPFMHDELSALIRAQANSFSELLEKGTTTDVHPLGVHVFIHYWSAVFGDSEIAIKFPFILMGIASIFFSYKIAAKWFNPTTGLLTAAFMATLQFTTMYGQLARPYASGLFFCTWMVWCWSEFLLGEKRRTIGFIIAATLCCYNHYFSLVFAGMVGVTGFLFLKKEKAGKYLFACGTILLLFVPHISISIAQFSGGQEQGDWWIGKPDKTWFIHFLKYLFHYSWIVYSLVIALLVLSLTFLRNEFPLLHKMRLVCFLWIILPFSIVYIYSVLNKPILQFSSMTFSLPFLFMLMFSFFKDISVKAKTILVSIVVLVNGYSLFAEREHAHVFYKQAYDEMARMSTEVIREQGAENVASAHAITEGFMDYYKKKYGEFEFLLVGKPDFKAFEEYVIAQKGDYFVAGNLPGEYISIIKKYYPCLIKRQESFTSWVDCFSKKQEACIKDQASVYSVHNKTERIMAASEESILLYKEKLKKICLGLYHDLNAYAIIENQTEGSNPVLVCAMSDSEKQVFWVGAEYNSFVNKEGQAILRISIPMRDYNLSKYVDPEIKIYIWNKDKGDLYIEGTGIEISESNHYVYGLFEPF